jgi:hypothetical protein
MHRPYLGSLIARRELGHARQQIERVAETLWLGYYPHAGGDLVVVSVHRASPVLSGASQRPSSSSRSIALSLSGRFRRSYTMSAAGRSISTALMLLPSFWPRVE